MRFITLNQDSVVIAIRHGSSKVGNEIESEIGELGQIKQPDGTFVTPEPVITETIETLEQKLERLEQQRQADSLVQFEVLATIYEELLMKS